jgi:hypothetical protein
MYVKCNTTLLNVGEVQTATPPASLTLPDVTPSTFTLGVAGGVEIDLYTGTAAGRVAFAFSRPVSPGVGFMKTFWQPLGAAGYSAGNVAPYALLTATYAAEFGTPVVGQKVFARITPCNDDGWIGTPLIMSTLVVA